jgi:CBS domain-containing protein
MPAEQTHFPCRPAGGRSRWEASVKIREVMTPDIEVVTPEDTLRTAVQLMADLDFDALPVSEDNRLIGTITGRDIAVRVVSQGQEGREITVRQAMSPDVLYCFENEPVNSVSQKMADWWVRRLPVVKQDKRVIGMVSLADLTALQAVTEKAKIRMLSHRSQAARSARQTRRARKTAAAA